jgi:holo-[acyl-carrier protein] synthase
VAIGIDIVEIARIGRSVERWGERFLGRVFTDREIEEWHVRGERMSLLAGKFATKEAFVKVSEKREIRWKDIEVLGVPFQRPVLWFRGEKMNVELSISHTQQIAVSVVVSNECG